LKKLVKQYYSPAFFIRMRKHIELSSSNE